MEELLQAPTEGYGEAIVILKINADHFEIKTNLLQLVQANPYHGFERENPHTHINNFKSITSTLKFKDVPNDVIKLMMFPYSLEGAARVWYDNEPPNSILTWEDLVNKFVNQFFPPSKTTHLKNEICHFTQRFDETFREACERFKEILRACPHHGFNDNDQDSLNAATGENILSKTTREALQIIENKSKDHYSRNKPNVSRMNTNSRENASKTDDRIDMLADQISTLVDIFAKKVVTPASVKAGSDFILEEIEAYLKDESISPEIDHADCDPEGDICLVENLLNNDSFQLPSIDLKQEEVVKAKSSTKEPLELELKDLPSHLEYAYLEGEDKLPVIIAKDLKDNEKEAHLKEDYKPAVRSQRRVIPKIHEVTKKEVIKLLDAGMIYLISESPWVSPINCVPKKSGIIIVENENNELIPTRLVTGWRVCIDYRKLNDATRKDHFPLPFMDQMLERLAGKEFYCFLDGFSGYFQILINPPDQEKTTFTCPYGTFAYRRMPFGLCNAPWTFQRCMMAIFHDMIKKTMKVFMDDFLVFGDSFSSCLSYLDTMLQRCEDTNLVLNWEKCYFMVKERIVLGHKIFKNRVEVDRAKVNVIAKLPHPTTLKDVPNDVIKLMMFPYSLEGAARVWYDNEPPNSILTWEDLVNKFVNQFFPPSKTTHLKNEICHFTQRFDETFREACERFKEILRACPHHGFNDNDQDSLNAATGENILSKTTREALQIIENKSKDHYSRNKPNVSRMNTNSRENASKTDDRIDMLADQISTLVDIFAKKVVTPASVKAAYLKDESISPEIDHADCDPEGDICLVENLLNNDSFQLPSIDLKQEEVVKAKSSTKEPLELELKDLPSHLEYAYLEGEDKLPVIIAKDLKDNEKEAHLKEDYKPAVRSQRRVIPKIHEVTKKEVIKLLDAGMIYLISESPWVSPINCVPKKSGIIIVENENNELIPTRLVTGWRVCIDYRKLNDATRKDHFPLPFMDQMLERLAGKEFYCFLDGFSGYFQILINPPDQEKTTFTCPYGTFAYRRMPFGLCNAPWTFQRCMMAIFHDMIKKTMKVFMDDFLVFGDSFSSCLSYLDTMLQRCEDTNLVLNWEKCYFMVKERIVLGHKIFKNRVEVDRAKVNVIAKLPHPTTLKGVRSFLGHAGFY
nr:reverse transcriptase domain-containing protein [Tanacetum cinerariifolium]